MDRDAVYNHNRRNLDIQRPTDTKCAVVARVDHLLIESVVASGHRRMWTSLDWQTQDPSSFFFF